jgi:nucleoside-diphosphate-sugar epimerase
MKVLVTGGTGALGREVVRVLRASNHQARVLSRKPSPSPSPNTATGTGDDWIRGNLATGAGLETAVSGIDAIIHAASATTDWTKLQATDVVGTRRLLAMAREAKVRHFGSGCWPDPGIVACASKY